MLNKGKHVVAEIEGTRCTVVEAGLSEERAAFLKEILQHNNYEVKIEMEKAKDGTPTGTCVLGVTDIIFNPMIKVYQRKLFRPDGEIVTPAYWNQWPEDKPEVPYIEIRHGS
ncbi:MAG: hypothetical protein ACM3N9_03330 [Syntrophothermus sp.]